LFTETYSDDQRSRTQAHTATMLRSSLHVLNYIDECNENDIVQVTIITNNPVFLHSIKEMRRFHADVHIYTYNNDLRIQAKQLGCRVYDVRDLPLEPYNVRETQAHRFLDTAVKPPAYGALGVNPLSHTGGP
jgi:hypothetical protein